MGRGAYNGGGTIIARGGKWSSGLDEVPLTRCEPKATRNAPQPKLKPKKKPTKKTKSAPCTGPYSRSLNLTEMKFLERVAKAHAKGKGTPSAPKGFSARVARYGTVNSWISADGDRRRYYLTKVQEAENETAVAAELADILQSG